MEDSFDGVEEEALVSAREEIKDCQAVLSKCEEELRRIQDRKMELQSEVDRLTELAEKALLDASKAEEDVASIMVLAEQAVALEMEAAQHANDAELALQRAEKAISSVDTMVDLPPLAEVQKSNGEDRDSEMYESSSDDIYDISDSDEVSSIDRLIVADLAVEGIEKQESAVEGIEKQESSRETSYEVSGDKLLVEPQKETTTTTTTTTTKAQKETEPETDNKSSKQEKKQEIERKELTKGPLSAPKALLKRSSRFFSASFFSSKVDGEFAPTSVFQGLMTSMQKQAPKLVVGVLLLGAGKPCPWISCCWCPHRSLWALSVIRNVHRTKAIAEFGVVFLLFNIGLELSVERLSSMKKYVFGLGSAQVLVTTAAVGMIAHRFAAVPGPAAIVIGCGLALSSTAVVLQALP